MKPYSFRRIHLLGLVLLVVVAANVIPRFGSTRAGGAPGGEKNMEHPPGFDEGGGDPEFHARVEAAIAKLGDEDRRRIEERLAKDREFFDSLRSLPSADRSGALRTYLAENPPPRIPGLQIPGGGPGANAGGALGGGGPGGPGDGMGGEGPGSGRIPPPEVRRGFDQKFVEFTTEGGMP